MLLWIFTQITYIIFFSVRERAVFDKSCNLIGSESGQYSPRPACSQREVPFRNHSLGFRKIWKCYSPAIVGPYWEKLCPLSCVLPEASDLGHSFFPIRTSRLVNNIYVTNGLIHPQFPLGSWKDDNLSLLS